MSLSALINSQGLSFQEWAKTPEGRATLWSTMQDLLMFNAQVLLKVPNPEFEHTVANACYSLPHRFREEGAIFMLTLIAGCANLIDHLLNQATLPPEEPTWSEIKVILREWCEQTPRLEPTMTEDEWIQEKESDVRF